MLEPGQLLKAILGVAGAWFALGLLGLAYPQGTRYVARVLFPLGALLALALAGLALVAIAQPAATMTLPVGLPDLPVHLRLDGWLGLRGADDRRARAAVAELRAGFGDVDEVSERFHAAASALRLALVHGLRPRARLAIEPLVDLARTTAAEMRRA